MANKRHQNLLLVEGEEDKRTIPYLIEANGINWGTRKEPIVYIEPIGGDNSLITPELISTELKASGRKGLGIMVDADDNALSKWESIRNSCLPSIPNLPETLPETGLIHSAPNDINFGVWVMPDNRMRGMLETFLAYLIPDTNEPLWLYAQKVAKEAKNLGAPFRNAHTDKAYIHTWLAWRDPPGRPLHNAVKEKILDPQHPKAQTFISWFTTLYQLTT